MNLDNLANTKQISFCVSQDICCAECEGCKKVKRIQLKTKASTKSFGSKYPNSYHSPVTLNIPN